MRDHRGPVSGGGPCVKLETWSDATSVLRFQSPREESEDALR